MSDPNEIPGGRPPVLMTGREPPRPWRPPAAPSPPRFDSAAARGAVTAALRSGSLASGLAAGRAALEASNRALAEVEQGSRPDAALKGWAERLPAATTVGGAKGGLAEGLDQALLPLLDGARSALTRAAGRQRAEEDAAAGGAWVNEASRLAAQAPAGLAQETGHRIARILGPELGKLFLDKVAAWRVRRDLDQDADRDLAADPRLAGVAPEVLEDLERDRLRLAREQGLSREVEAARQRSALSRALAAEATAVTRGEAGPPRMREEFLDLYGPRDGETRWQLRQAHQAKAPAYALVRGRSPQEIAAAKAGYQGDTAILERIEQEDTAERARDPAGYGLTWAKGYRRAYEEAQDPADKAAVLWEAQAAAGIPENERSPWTAEQAWAFAEQWAAIGEEGSPHQVAKARIGLVREALSGMPPELRAAGVAQLARLGLEAAAPGRIGRIAAAINEKDFAAAYAAAQASPDLVAPAARGETPTTYLSERGLPASLNDSWVDQGYAPQRRDELLHALDQILAVERSPQLLPDVHARIAAVFAGDPVALKRYRAHADVLADVEGDDRFLGDVHRTQARDAITETLERVGANEPYDEVWASARPQLARLEADSGLRLRPADGPGLVAVYEPGSSAPLFVLPLQIIETLEGDGEELALYATLVGKLLRGEDISAELAAYERRLVVETRYLPRVPVDNRGPDGFLHLVDRSAFDEFVAAIEGARARLEEGQDPNAVFLNLAQVALAEELDDTDLAVAALRTALEFLPYYDFVDLGINAVQLFEALEAGNGEAAVVAGLGAALAAIGAVPILGDLAKSGLSWVARKVGLLPTPKSRALKWLTTKANAVGETFDHLEQKIRAAVEGKERRFERYVNRGPENGFSWTSRPKGKAWKKLPEEEKQKYYKLTGSMNNNRGGLAESTVGDITDSLRIFAGTSRTTRTVHLRVVRANGSVVVKKMDIARFPDDSPILRDVNAGVRGTETNPLTPREVAAEGGFIVESKVGSAKLDRDQVLAREQVMEEARLQGREVVWFDTHMPTHNLDLKVHLALVRDRGRHFGFTDSQIEQLVKDVRGTFPRTWPSILLIAATELALFQLYFDADSDQGSEQIQGEALPAR